jgi:hypothetical protein
VTAQTPAPVSVRAAEVIRPFSDPDAVQDHGDGLVDRLAIVEPTPWWVDEVLADAA